jgi:hypothetical protein
MTTASTTAFRATANGGRKHLAQCPHVVGSTTRPVLDREDLPVCDWCAKELSGHGRRYFDDLRLALDAFRAPLENRRLIQDELQHVEHDSIWMPYSGSYIALGLEGRGVAWTGKTYVVPRAGVSIALHGYTDSEHRGISLPEQRTGGLCPSCWLVRSVSGVCGCS